jgi:hypothetical protein
VRGRRQTDVKFTANNFEKLKLAFDMASRNLQNVDRIHRNKVLTIDCVNYPSWVTLLVIWRIAVSIGTGVDEAIVLASLEIHEICGRMMLTILRDIAGSIG